MSCATFEVKRWLSEASDSKSGEALQRAFAVIKEAQSASDPEQLASLASDLSVQCCEVAIQLEQWHIAAACVLLFKDTLKSTVGIEARAFYCEGLLRLHAITTDLRGSDMTDDYLAAAASIVQGLALVVEEWPREARVVVEGVAWLWQAIAPLYSSARFDAISGTVEYVVRLHGHLTLGGPFEQVAWLTRYASCLMHVGRVTESIAQFAAAFNLAVELQNERLQVQLTRCAAPAVASRDTGNAKGKPEAPNYTKSPVLHAAHLAQLVLSGLITAEAALPDLVNLHSLLTSAERSDSAVDKEAPHKTKVKHSKSNALESVGVRDTLVVEEVVSDVNLCLALCGQLQQCDASHKKMRNARQLRHRVYAAFAEAAQGAFNCGLHDIYSASDNTCLTAALQNQLLRLIHDVEVAMDDARMIEDRADRSYALLLGCSLLWNLSLPLLQEDTRASLTEPLRRMTSTMQSHATNLTGFQVRAEYELCVSEYDQDHLSLVEASLSSALSRFAAERDHDGSEGFPIDFQMLWLQRSTRLRLRTFLDEFCSAEEEAHALLEQAKYAHNASRRLVLLKAAYQKLPPLSSNRRNLTAKVESATAMTSTTGGLATGVSRAPKKSFRALSNDKSRLSSAAAGEAPSAPLPKQSTWTLYVSLLRACGPANDMSPTLLPIALAVAQALCATPLPSAKEAQDFWQMKADAHVALASLLMHSAAADEGMNTRRSYSHVPPLRKKAVDQLIAAAQLNESLQNFGDASVWVTFNAVQLYLNWHAEQFAAGELTDTLEELLVLYNLVVNLEGDLNREGRLVAELAFFCVLALLHDYMRGTGKYRPEDNTAHSLDGLVQLAYSFTIFDQSHASLKKALAICHDVSTKVLQPSLRVDLSLLLPCVHRLLSGGRVDNVVSTQPQDRLLYLLGLLSTPLTVAEKQAFLKRELLPLLRLDPAVQLCGRVSLVAVMLHDELAALEACQIANKLYADGKLGWGTSGTAVADNTSSAGGIMKTKAATSSTGGVRSQPTSTAQLPESSASVWPRPTAQDWFWYARLHHTHAFILRQRMEKVDQLTSFKVGVTVLTLCTNSLIAATYGTRTAAEMKAALALYMETLQCLRTVGCDSSELVLLLPSLKMLLGKHILSYLVATLNDTKNDLALSSEAAWLVEALSTLADALLQCCTARGALQEGMQILIYVLRVLPSRYHGHFALLHLQYSCALGHSGVALMHTRRQSNDAATEVRMWMFLARSAENRTQSLEAWRQALATAQNNASLRAVCLTSMAAFLCRYDDFELRRVRLLLLSALDALEGRPSAGSLRSHDRGSNSCCLVVDHRARQTRHDSGSHSHLLRSSANTSKKSVRLTEDGITEDERDRLTAPPNSCSRAGLLSMRDAMQALRIVFLLFALAEESPTPRDKGTVTDGTSKSQYAVLMVHYIECLWRLVEDCISNHLTSASSASSDPSDLAPSRRLSIPERADAWCGFVMDDSHVRAFAKLSRREDAELNTEAMQGICLILLDYLLDARMAPYCFIVGHWLHFAACWRYDGGGQSIVTQSVQRVAFLQCQRAMALCRCRPTSSLYAVPPLSPLQRHEIKEALARLPVPQSRATAPCALEDDAFIGSFGDVLIRDAEICNSTGRYDEVQGLLSLVAPLAERANDEDICARLHLIHLSQLEIQNKAEEALRYMSQVEDKHEFLESLSLPLWTAWRVRRLQLYCSTGDFKRVSTAISGCTVDLQARAGALGSPLLVGPHVALIQQQASQEKFDGFVTTYVVNALLSASRNISVGVPEANVLTLQRDCFTNSLARLQSSSNLWSRFLAAAAHFRVRRFWSDANERCPGHDPGGSEHRDKAKQLAEEATVLDQLLQEVDVMVSSACLTNFEAPNGPPQSSWSSVQQALMCMHAQNAMDREDLVREVVCAYRGLSMEELNIPRGDGPSELEQHVLDYMRNPCPPESASATATATAAVVDEHTPELPARLSCEHRFCEEVKQALSYFHIPLEWMRSAGCADAARVLGSAVELAHTTVFFGYLHPALQFGKCEWHRLVVNSLQATHECGAADFRASEVDAHISSLWARTPLTAPTSEKLSRSRPPAQGEHHHSHRATVSASPPLHERESWLLALLRRGIAESLFYMDFLRAAQYYILVAHFYTMWGHSQAAGFAVELATAARLAGFLTQVTPPLLEDSQEGVRVRALTQLLEDQFVQVPLSSYEGLREAAVASSPLLARADRFCALPEQFDAALEGAVDGTVLSIARDDDDGGSNFLVTLRRADGKMESRRVMLNLDRIKELVQTGERCATQVKQQLLMQQATASARERSKAPSFPAEDNTGVTSFFTTLEEVMNPLFSQFDDALKALGNSKPLYLCLDPLLQPLPLEQLSSFSNCHSILRELSVRSILLKQPQKSEKHSGGPLLVVDPLGQHSQSLNDMFPVESRSRSTPATLVTSTRGADPHSAYPPSLPYLRYELQSPTAGNVLFNLCGPLAGVLPTAVIANLYLDHVQSMLVASDGVVGSADASYEQEGQLHQKMHNAKLSPSWIYSLIFLARGVRYFGVRALPHSAQANDVLCRRCLPLLSGNRNMWEVCNVREGKRRSSPLDFVIFYGVPLSLTKTK